MTGAPSGVSINSSNGSISGTPTETGTFTLTVKVEDEEGTTDSCSFTMTVNAPALTISCPADQTATKCTAITEVTPTVGGGCPDYTFSMTGAPAGVKIDECTGEISGEPTETGTFNANVTVTDAEGNTASCNFAITVSCPTISIAKIDDVTATAGENMPARTATASGGKSPYTYGISGEPSGVTINSSTGVISGKPAETGEFDVTVTATSACGCEGTREFTITVSCPTITVGGLSDVTVTVGKIMPMQTATASKGKPPHTFSLTGAPAGVNINVDDTPGKIGGTPTETGEFDVTVTATDSIECAGEKSFTIHVTKPLEIHPIDDVDALVDVAISPITATASGGVPSYTFSMSGAPPGFSIVAATGRITGTPRQAQAYTVSVTVRDSVDDSAHEDFQLRVTLPLRLASISNVVASRHEAISAIQVSATGGKPPYDYSLTASPSSGAGLSISSSGSITGTPTAVGSFTIRVTVTDDDDATKSRSFTMQVAEAIVIGPINDMYGEIFATFSEGPVDVSGGVTPYTYSLSGQPSGLDVNQDGEVVGTPTESGDFDVTLTVTDNDGRTESILFFITISTGDFNNDGKADAADAKLFNEKMGLRRSDEGYDRRMDMNGDGIINYADFVILSRHIERDASSQGGGGSGG